MASGHRTRRDARTTRDRARPASRRQQTRRRPVAAPEGTEHLDLGGLDDEVTEELKPTGDDTDSDVTDQDDGEATPGSRRSRTAGGASRISVHRRTLARWQRINTRRTLVLAVVLTAVALTLAMPMRTYFSQRAEFGEQRALNAQLREEVVDYQQQVNEQNDPAYIEAQARQRLQYVMPGEKPLVMVYEGREEQIAAQEAADQRARNPWYVNLWDAVATPPGTD